MPKIPTTQQTVSTQTPRVAEYNIPGAVRGAFGENVTAATSKLIEGVGDIGQMFQEKAEQMYKVKNAELENEFILANQDILHNDKTKVIKIDGVDTEIPDGIGDRMGYQTNGAATEYEKRSADLRDSILKKVKHEGYRSELTQRLSSHYLSGREFTIKHEIAETRKAAKDTFGALSKTLVESVKADPATLGMAIDKIIKNHLDERNRLGTPLAQMDLEVNEDIAKATYNAADSILQMGGTLKEAKAFINGEQVRSKIPKEKYNELTNDLETSSKRIKSIKDWEIKQTNTQTAFDLSQGLIDKSLTPQTVRKAQQAGLIDPMTAAIFEKVSAKEKLNIPDTTELTKSDYFLRLLDETIKNKDENAMMKAIKDATVAYGDGKLGFYQYAYFIQEANKKFKDPNSKGVWPETMVKFTNAAKAIDNFAKNLTKPFDEWAGTMIFKLLQKVNTGIDPTVAGKQVQNETVLELHPEALSYPEEGKKVMDATGAIKIITPEGEIRDEPVKKETQKSEKKKPESKK